jgi:hypothetical protein
MKHLPDAEQQVELEPSLLVVELVRGRDLYRRPVEAFPRALAPLKEVEKIVDEFLVTEPQADSHRPL